MKWAIDVSSYDSVLDKNRIQAIDWTQARDEGGLSLAIIKCSEGIRQDPAFTIQWTAVSGILPRAAYHFFRSNVDAIKQAQACWTILSAAGFTKDDYLILDYETLDGLIPSRSLLLAASWLYEMEKHGVTPMIYTYPAFWESIKGPTATWAAKYPLALAQWPKDNWILKYSPTIFNGDKLDSLKNDIEKGVLKPMMLKPWSSPAIWQFTARVDSRAIPGHPAVKKVVDYDAVLMTLPQPISEIPATGPKPATPDTPLPDPAKPPVIPGDPSEVVPGSDPGGLQAGARCPTCGQIIPKG
jgi:hypothetical protein